MKILILEDEEVLLELYSKKISEKGHTVKAETSINDSIKTLKTFSPDLALIDYGIKGEQLSGLDLVKKIKKTSPHTKIVMLSNYSHNSLREACKDAGVDDFLIKLNTPPQVLTSYLEKFAN